MSHYLKAFKSNWFIFPMALVVTSCTLGPDFQRPSWGFGNKWKESSKTEKGALPDDWWRLFNEPELNRLVQKSLAANQDLAAAKSRVDTSRALVGVDRARMFPSLDLSGKGSSIRLSKDAVGSQLPPGINIPLDRESYRSTFDLSYDLDLWGRNRRQLEAANANADASVALYQAQRLGLATEVARQYFLLRGLDQQATVLQSTVQSRQSSYDLQKSKANAGLEDSLVINRARTELELARNDLSLVDRQRGASEHALAVLCGEAPSDFSLARSKSTMKSLPMMHAGSPADLLNRRPDLRAAEQKLKAANARIGVAEAGFYPSFNLFASGGWESVDVSRFLDWENRVLSLGGGVVAPIFHGGSTKAAWNAAVSSRDEALASYKNSLLIALREVEDALLDLKGLARSRQSLEQALTSARESSATARERYDKGLISYLEVVESERAALSIQLLLAQCDANQRITLAALAKALGGGWGG